MTDPIESNQEKMKEQKKPPPKTQVQVVSRGEMTADQQRSFQTAVDALLTELMSTLDRRKEGESNEKIEEQVARFACDRRRTAKRR